MKKYVKGILKSILKIFIVMIIIVLVIAVGLFIWYKISLNKEFNDLIKNATENGETYIYIEINPKLMLVLDKDNNVKEISPVNVDGYKITDDQDYTGLDLESAINKIITVAKENNYLTDKKEIIITTITEDKGNFDKIKQYVASIDDGINVVENSKNAKNVYEEMKKDLQAVIAENTRRLVGDMEEAEREREERDKADREKELERIKKAEKEYIDRINQLKKEGYKLTETREDELLFTRDYETATETGSESAHVWFPYCETIYGVTKEECETYCPHCKYEIMD